MSVIDFFAMNIVPRMYRGKGALHPAETGQLTDEVSCVREYDVDIFLNDMDCTAPIRAAANLIFPRLRGGDVKMYRRDEIVGMLEAAGFSEVSYRKISPFSFLCTASKPRPAAASAPIAP